MLDVEYLLTRPGFDGTVVYRYRSGVLRPRVLAALHEVAKQEGRYLISGDREDIIGDGTGSLMEVLPVYDFWNLGQGRRMLENALARIAAMPGERAAYFVPALRLRDHPLWPGIAATCLVIDEPLVTRETLIPVLAYLEAVTDVAECPQLATQPGFVESIEMRLGRNGAELPDVIHAFDEIVLTCTDAKTNRFDARQQKSDLVQRQGRTSPLRRVRDLITNRQPWDLVLLLSCFDQRYWQRRWTVHHMVREFYRVTEELLSAGHSAPSHKPATNRSETHRPETHRPATSGRTSGARASNESAMNLGIILWTAMVIAWDARLIRGLAEAAHGYRRGPDLLMVTIEQLGRDFLTRAGRHHRDDPLAGTWQEVELGLTKIAALHNDGLALPRAKVLRCFGRFLTELSGPQVPWVHRLRRCVMNAVEEIERASSEPDSTNEKINRFAAAPAVLVAMRHPSAPRTFETIIGHANAVAGLRKRVQTGAHQTPVILHGPQGAGKRTLAGIYAQAMLCMAPTQSGSPCHQCGECQAFNQGSILGYIELDVSNGVDVRTTRDVIGRLTGPRLTERCAVVIENADMCPPAAFDVLLKTLEEMTAATTFVLLAVDLKNLRLAGQSRSELYRVRPLSPAESHAFLKTFGDAMGRGYDARVLDLLAAIGQGLPGRLQQVWALALTAGEPTLEAVQGVLGQDWADEMAAYWGALLAGEEQPGRVPEGPLTGRDEQMRRARIFLTELYVRGLKRAPMKMAGVDPALLHVEETFFSNVAFSLEAHAESRRMSPEELWRVLAQHWMSDSLVNTLSSTAMSALAAASPSAVR